MDTNNDINSGTITVVPLTSVKPGVDVKNLGKDRLFLGSELHNLLDVKIRTQILLLTKQITSDSGQDIEEIEKILQNAKRTQNYIRSQIELTKSEILNANSEIDFLKLETDAKVKRISNENQKINTSKEYQLKSIKERLEKEKSTNKDLKEKIKEAETRIKEISGKIENASVQENKKNIAILKELADMNKFLSEL